MSIEIINHAHAAGRIYAMEDSVDGRRLEVAFHSSSLHEEAHFDTKFPIVTPSGIVRHLKAAAKVMLDTAESPVRVVRLQFDVTSARPPSRQRSRANSNFVP